MYFKVLSPFILHELVIYLGDIFGVHVPVSCTRFPLFPSSHL